MQGRSAAFWLISGENFSTAKVWMPTHLWQKAKNEWEKEAPTKKGDDNIISNGSIISINEGQNMIIVESGKIVEFCA